MWNEIWPKHTGMLNLQLQLERLDEKMGKVNINFQPSNIVKNGVFTSINDHYSFADQGKFSANEAANFVREQWPNSKLMAEKLFKDVYDRVIAG